MSPDRLTRATRTAANAAAVAVVIYLVLWIATTQVRAIREISPFADDPWDAVASYAAIFLPFVAGATWIRSIRHRGPILPAVTAARIRWGAGLAVGIVLTSVGADLVAILSVPSRVNTAGDITAAIIVLVVGLAGLAAASAAALLLWARSVARAAAPPRTDRLAAPPEPDIVDDFLAIAADVARPIGLGEPIRRVADAVEHFLDFSALSPRRHRIIFGAVLAIAAAVAFDVWLGVVEDGWASPVVPLVLGTLMAVGVLGIYLGTVVPLRLLRSVDQADAPE